jgi:hypothetical protein
LGEAKNELMWKCFGLMYQGNVSCWLGKFTEARAYYENALSLWDPTYSAFAATPENPYVASLCHLSRALLCLGYVDQARLRRDEALAQARTLPLYNLVFALVQVWWGIDWVTAGGKPEARLLPVVGAWEHTARLVSGDNGARSRRHPAAPQRDDHLPRRGRAISDAIHSYDAG